LKKFKGVFIKYPGPANFPDLLNYFPTEKGQINLCRWFFFGCSDFNENKGGILVLILAVDLRMDDPEHISFLDSVRPKQSAVGTGLRELKLAL
jgi:hypothetical protein